MTSGFTNCSSMSKVLGPDISKTFLYILVGIGSVQVDGYTDKLSNQQNHLNYPQSGGGNLNGDIYFGRVEGASHQYSKVGDNQAGNFLKLEDEEIGNTFTRIS